MIRRLVSCLAVALVLSLASSRSLAQPAPSGDVAKAVTEMTDAATKFWNSLKPEQQAKAGFGMTDAERTNWHFTPGPWQGVARKGLPWKDMTPEQVKLGHDLVKTGLSQMGYDKAEATQANEDILGGIERSGGGRSNFTRDPQNYMISIFGKPGTKEGWGWRFEGHHLAFNFTVVDGDMVAVATPNFFGSNPAKYPEGTPKAGQRVLADEEDTGRKLIKALSEENRKIAIINVTAPSDIVTGEKARPDPLKPEGITGDKLTADQKKMLMDIVTVYVNRQRPALAKVDMDQIEKAGGVDKLWFAWAGTIEVGGPHYYRVQGPTFLIEYDNTQNNANHIHSVWRNATSDFGEDILKKHYAEVPH